jgi:cytochrome c-type biogenesis protein
MQELFTWLTRAVEGAPVLALSASFIWGVLSMVLSPCHLAGIPLLIGLLSGQEDLSPARAFLISGLFAFGNLLSIAFIGIATAAAGRLVGDIGGVGNYLVAGVLMAVGLFLLGVFKLPWSGPGPVSAKRTGLLAGLMLGIVFGLALGPCTFAYMAPMLAISFKIASAQMAYGVLLLAAYGLGHCSVIVLAGTSAERVQYFLEWNKKSRGTVIVKRICGVLVILGGLYVLYLSP